MEKLYTKTELEQEIKKNKEKLMLVFYHRIIFLVIFIFSSFYYFIGELNEIQFLVFTLLGAFLLIMIDIYIQSNLYEDEKNS